MRRPLDIRRTILSEGRALLGLPPHPALPTVREDFFAGDSYCMVLDWVDGVSLAQVLEERGTPGLPLEEVVGHLGRVAAALDHLHAQSPYVVHGDVKPANIVVGSDGAVLVDFGVAGSGERQANWTGTPGYVAPEVGSREGPTPASDIFSLAATAFALLTGSPPRPGARPRWRRVARERAPQVELALRRGLAFDPSRRPATASELVTALAGELVSPTNLPIALTTLVGRSAELKELGRLSQTTRLLTISGTGGVGKTRLALALAGDVLSEHPDGVFWVELGSLSEPTLVPHQVATSLAVQEEPGRTLADTVVAHLEGRRMLLVLDNCEHLLEVVARLVQKLLTACAHLRVATTTRVPLGIPGEVVWRVPSLSESEAEALFVDRTGAAKPGFQLTNTNAPYVSEICARLDGIPLAIELAAARASTLGLEELARRLDDRFRVLGRGPRTAPRRQQTLRATVEWSYELLSDAERLLFNRFAVFAGTFGLDAAEAVGTGPGVEGEEVVNLLAALVDHSLVVADDGRFRMLETLRQYAGERLAEAGEETATRHRHLSWFTVIAGRVAEQLKGAGYAAAMRRLEQDYENLGAAIAWARQANPSAGLELLGNLPRFYATSGRYREARRWLEDLMRTAPHSSPAVRARAHLTIATMAWHQGDYHAAAVAAEQAHSLFAGEGDLAGQAEALSQLASVAILQGDTQQARNLVEQALPTWRAAGVDQGLFSTRNVDLHNLGFIAETKGDLAEARLRYGEALALGRAIGDDGTVLQHLAGLGRLALRDARYDEARNLLRESLALARGLGFQRGISNVLTLLAELATAEGALDHALALLSESLERADASGQRPGIAQSLSLIARVAYEHGDAASAARLLGAADALLESMGQADMATGRSFEALTTVRSALRGSYATAWREGRGWSVTQAVGEARSLATGLPHHQSDPPFSRQRTEA